jgi:hypothetical protein
MALDKLKSSALDTNIDIAGTLDVTSTTTLDSGLSVAGAAAVAGHSSIGNAGTVDSTRALTVVGATDGTGSSILVGYNSSLASKFSVRDDGYVNVGNGLNLADGNLSFASGHGIDFSANANASGMTSELLDDYEEGTWTSVPIVGTYSFNSPRYTKIGRMVHCHAQIGTISDNSSSQSLRIQLPFAAVSNDTAVSFGTLYVNVGRNPIVGGYLSGTTDLILYVNNTFSQLFHSDTSSNTSIYAAWSYMAAS